MLTSVFSGAAVCADAGTVEIIAAQAITAIAAPILKAIQTLLGVLSRGVLSAF
jgi:hypothetical protein